MRIKWNNMTNYIAEQKAQGIEDIIVSPTYFHSFYKRYGDWNNPSVNSKIPPILSHFIT